MELQDLLTKINTELSRDKSVQVQADTELLMSGLLDSFAVVSLVAWLEDELGHEIDPGEVVFENFESPQQIIAMTATLLKSTPN